jgi:hypothetical protein
MSVRCLSDVELMLVRYSFDVRSVLRWCSADTQSMPGGIACRAPDNGENSTRRMVGASPAHRIGFWEVGGPVPSGRRPDRRSLIELAYLRDLLLPVALNPPGHDIIPE